MIKTTLQNTNMLKFIKMIWRRIKILAKLWWYQKAFDANMSESDVQWFISKDFSVKHVTESCYSIGFTQYQVNYHESIR